MRKFQNDPYWRDYILFHEYFNGDDGAGLGASHQTGWTGTIALLMDIFARVSQTRALEFGKKRISPKKVQGENHRRESRIDSAVEDLRQPNSWRANHGWLYSGELTIIPHKGEGRENAPGASPRHLREFAGGFRGVVGVFWVKLTKSRPHSVKTLEWLTATGLSAKRIRLQKVSQTFARRTPR